MLAEITWDEAEQLIYGAERSLFRWEQQPAYFIGEDPELLRRFLAGNPAPPTDEPETRRWLEHVTTKALGGVAFGRVRVIEDPPTDYQRWLRWCARWNRMAGETVDYLSRSVLREMGPPPVFPRNDWWLIDDEVLVVMAYDAICQIRMVVRTDNEMDLFLARQWRDEVVAAART